MARDECRDPSRLAVWLPTLQQYGPDLLIQCQNVLSLSKTLVRDWLKEYMFKGDADRETKANNIAEWLGNHTEFKMHARHINREQLRQQGLNIVNLEDDKLQQDFILSILHAATHTFSLSGAVKIIENHLGSAYIIQLQQVFVPTAQAMPALTKAPILHQPPRKGFRSGKG